jgi:hypothetical protein
MAKKVSKKSSKKLPPLTDIQQQVMAYVMNSIAFQNYDDCCSVEEMAGHFKRSPGRFLPTLRKLAAKGYLTIEGDIFQRVYPTLDALRNQDKTLSEVEAKKILKKVR